MKKILAITFAVLAFALILNLAHSSVLDAAEVRELTATADSVFVGRSAKTGALYTRIIVMENRTSATGVDYELGIPAMAFGDQQPEAAKIKKGQEFKALVLPGEYNGKPTYQIVKMLQ